MKTYIDETKKNIMIEVGQKRRIKTLQKLYSIKNYCNVCQDLISYKKAYKKNKIGLNHENLICINKYKNLKTCSKKCQSLNYIFNNNNLSKNKKNRIIKYAKISDQNFKIIKYLAQKISNIKSRCNKNNFEFNLDIYYLLEILSLRCPITKKPFVFEEINLSKKNVMEEFMPSINRIDSRLGYIKGNVEWISWKANRIMNNADLHFIEKVLEHKKIQNKYMNIDKEYLKCFSI